MLFDKPKSVTLDIRNLKPEDLEYFCNIRKIDKMLMELKKLEFNQDIADEMDKVHKFYFVLKKNRQYDVVPGLVFEPWLKEHSIEEKPETAKSKFAVQHFIKSVS